eukprot:scaffold367214_cov18-Prasinocladus_malaysianus.AAC.1
MQLAANCPIVAEDSDYEYGGTSMGSGWSSRKSSVDMGHGASNMNDYRGISIMGSIMKLLMTIVAMRLSKICEERRMPSPAQAGFRFKDECPLQSKRYDTAAHQELLFSWHPAGSYVGLFKSVLQQ